MMLRDLNRLEQPAFVDAIGSAFEHSPWVAERAWARRPFRTVSDLHAAMVAAMAAASREEQLALLQAHPDLGSRLAMSEASTGEQASAGFDRLPPHDLDRLRHLNAVYREQFGFPFLLAVKGATAEQVLESLSRRVHSTPDVEWAEALLQVARIARVRLEQQLPSD
ncbi:MAG: 2-oxo-4-hydroxy-4-carboxy-5-ureidoimidazoline decarboxylase [Acidobacteriota bacterium]